MRNKSGKISVGVWVLIGLAVVAVFYFNVGGVQSLFGGAQQQQQQQQPTTINTVNPYITVTALDKQASGTAVGVSAQGAFNSGGFKSINLGSDTAVPGSTLELILTNNTQYHNAHVDSFNVVSTSFPVNVYFNKNASVTENIFSTTGLVMANGLGNQNQTKLGNGATYNFKDAMSGTSLASTQDMVCLIEVEEGANVSTTAGQGVTFNGVAPFSTSKPSWYTLLGSGSSVYLFNMAPLSSGAEVAQNIQVVNGASKQFSATMRIKKTCYTKEYFIDPNSGKVTYDVADSNGAQKSIALYTYTFYFT